MVECDLAKVEVAGSNPVSRSIFLAGMSPISGPQRGSLRLDAAGFLSQSQSDRRRRQVVRQRSAKPPSPVQIRAAPPTFARKSATLALAG